MTDFSLFRKRSLNKTPVVIIVILSGFYIANSFTPFRLGNDVLRYIQLKEWLELGTLAIPYAGNKLPYGYPLLLLLLSKFNVCNSFVIVLVNDLYLAGSLYFVSHLFKNQFKSWHLIALTLLTWTIIKNALTPLSDMQYMFFSTGTLFFFKIYYANNKIVYLALLIVFGFLAILTRTIGVLLFFSMGLALIFGKKDILRKRIPGLTALLVAITLFFLIIILFSNFFRVGDYVDLVFPFFKNDPAAFLLTNIRWHLSDWAELFINTSQFKIAFLSAGIKAPIFLLSGFVFMAYFLGVLIRARKTMPAVIIIYLLGYIAVIFSWPTYDARFWVPVLPLLLAVILQQANHESGYFRYALFAWKAIYVTFGIVAIGYYSYLTFNKKAFSERHDAGIWENEYKVHFWGSPLFDSSNAVREYPLRVLDKYDR